LRAQILHILSTAADGARQKYFFLGCTP